MFPPAVWLCSEDHPRGMNSTGDKTGSSQDMRPPPYAHSVADPAAAGVVASRGTAGLGTPSL